MPYVTIFNPHDMDEFLYIYIDLCACAVAFFLLYRPNFDQLYFGYGILGTRMQLYAID